MWDSDHETIQEGEIIRLKVATGRARRLHHVVSVRLVEKNDGLIYLSSFTYIQYINRHKSITTCNFHDAT